MSEAVKHTPGPWVNARRSAGAHICAGGGEVAWLRSYMQVPDSEIEANARLIVAAPDLLEAVKALIELGMSGSQQLAALRLAKAAIAKAEGQL